MVFREIIGKVVEENEQRPEEAFRQYIDCWRNCAVAKSRLHELEHTSKQSREHNPSLILVSTIEYHRTLLSGNNNNLGIKY